MRINGGLDSSIPVPQAAPADVRRALGQNTPQARQALEAYTQGKMFSFNGQLWETIPGSFHWNGSQNIGTARLVPNQLPEVTAIADKAGDTATGAGGSAADSAKPGSPPQPSPGDNTYPVARGAGEYSSVELEVNLKVRNADNARKAAVGTAASEAVEAIPAAERTAANMEKIARAAFDNRNASRSLSQTKLLPVMKQLTRFWDSPFLRNLMSRNVNWESLVAKNLSIAGGDSIEAYRRIVLSSGKGDKWATRLAKGFGVAGRVLGGLGARFSAYSLYRDIETRNYGIMLGDATGIVAGGFAVAGAAMTPAGLAFAGISLSNIAGDVVGSYVERKTGSGALGVAAGTATGAATGALFGAAVGSIVPVIGTAIGAGVGAVIGGIAGFIGSFW